VDELRPRARDIRERTAAGVRHRRSKVVIPHEEELVQPRQQPQRRGQACGGDERGAGGRGPRSGTDGQNRDVGAAVLVNALIEAITCACSVSLKSLYSGSRTSWSLTRSATGQSPGLPPKRRPIDERCSGR